MNVQELENLMVKHGLVIRAIPNKLTHIYETRHKDKYPQGTIKYLESFKREMLVFETVPKNAGKFLITYSHHTCCNVTFKGDIYFDSLEEIYNYLEKEGS